MLVAANVGDSRVLLVRNGEAQQLTVDHTVSARAAFAAFEVLGSWIRIPFEGTCNENVDDLSMRDFEAFGKPGLLGEAVERWQRLVAAIVKTSTTFAG